MERTIPVVFSFNGGYSTDLLPQTRDLTYFLKAENVIYEVSGAVHKVGGAVALTDGVPSAPDIVGMFDYHRAGTAGTFTQKFVLVTGDGRIFKEDVAGSLVDITGTAVITDDTHPVFCQARDLLTIFFSTCDTPLKWNQTGNVTPLLGAPPIGRGAVFHVNRLWVWGTLANPSRISYGSSTVVEDFVTSDTGSFDIDPDDGDIIVAAVSYKGMLIIFKGPNKGSIHVISGTGVSSFTRQKFVEGIPLQSPHGWVVVGDDILFMSDRGIHSLGATQSYGNFTVADLTRFLHGHFRNNMNRTLLSKVWAVDYSDKSCVIWTYPNIGVLENNATLGLSYVRFSEEGWKPFTWTRGGISACIHIDTVTNDRKLIFGGTDGVPYIQDTPNRSLPPSTAYNYRLQTPEIMLGKQDGAGTPRGDQPFTIERIYLRSISSGNYYITVQVSRDGKAPEAYYFHQGQPQFILGTNVLGDELGGTRMQIAYPVTDQPLGEARAVQFDISQGGLNQDANIVELGLEVTPTAQSNIGT